MTAFVALLRAVNVGGTGKLAMGDLVAMCAAAGFTEARTYIASGNVVLRSTLAEGQVRQALEARLHAHVGRPVGVIVRTGAEMAQALARNPFAQAPASRVMALFVDAPLPVDPLQGARGLADEDVRLGGRELFIFYPGGVGASRLRLPAERTGTARNLNTVARLAAMAAELG